MPIFFDTHAHLDYPDYAPDLAEVIARAQAAGITKMISIGTSLDSSERAIRLAEKFPAIYAAVGWHPSEALKAPSDLRPALRRTLSHFVERAADAGAHLDQCIDVMIGRAEQSAWTVIFERAAQHADTVGGQRGADGVAAEAADPTAFESELHRRATIDALSFDCGQATTHELGPA